MENNNGFMHVAMCMIKKRSNNCKLEWLCKIEYYLKFIINITHLDSLLSNKESLEDVSWHLPQYELRHYFLHMQIISCGRKCSFPL